MGFDDASGQSALMRSLPRLRLRLFRLADAWSDRKLLLCVRGVDALFLNMRKN
jgi:hypothetical protein